jgi:hypothetical protein
MEENNMTDSEILSEMIKPQAIITITLDNYGSKEAILADTNQSNYSVTIKRIPDDAIIIKSDLFPSPHPIFNDSKCECKRADFVIISETNKVIIYIEITIATKMEHEYVNQLKGAKCFIAYCAEIGRVFWDEPSFLKEYKHRYVFFDHLSISKQPSRAKKDNCVHDSPTNALKISSQQRIEFNHIACLKR